MNSMVKQEVNINATEILGFLVLPTQHSITRSRVSFAQVTSSGNSSRSSRGGEGRQECEFKTISYGTPPAADGEDVLEKWKGERGNEILEAEDPHLESFLPQSPWAKTARPRSGHCVPLYRTWLKVSNGCNMGVGVARKRGVVNYYKNEIDFLAVLYIPILSRAAWYVRTRPAVIPSISNNHGLFFRFFDSDCRGLNAPPGHSSEPQTLHAGADREGRLCQAQVGTRIQGILGLDRWVHESPGTPSCYLPRRVFPSRDCANRF